MTEPETHTLDAPGAVLHYDVRRNDASTQPVLLLLGLYALVRLGRTKVRRDR